MIGILGGIGSGKSTVVRHVDGLNLLIIDADRIGHDLLEDPDIQEQIRATFGDDVFDESGGVNRRALADRVFGNGPDSEGNRRQLNRILHPAIHREIYRQIQGAAQDVDAVILDAALLLEAGWDDQCDWLIFIDTPIDQRVQRAMSGRGWSREELVRREATQFSPQQKKQRAHFVVDNSGTIEDSAGRMKQILQTIVEQAAKR